MQVPLSLFLATLVIFIIIGLISAYLMSKQFQNENDSSDEDDNYAKMDDEKID